jgi:hypothetical protein
VAIVAGFRYPATWALMLLTKVTPGIGLLWFLVRREWRSLAMAVGVSAGIAAVSFFLDRSAWEEWIAILRSDLAVAGQASFQTPGWYLAVPLLPRLAVAAVVAVVAALSDRRWLLPVAVAIALPVVWFNAMAVLAAVVPLWLARARAVDQPVPAAVARASEP